VNRGSIDGERTSQRGNKSAGQQAHSDPFSVIFWKSVFSAIFSDFSAIDFGQSACFYPFYFERFGRHFTVFSALLHSFTVSVKLWS
jgi:hypothetical protein